MWGRSQNLTEANWVIKNVDVAWGKKAHKKEQF